MKIICEKGYHAGNVLRLVAEYLEKRYPDDMILDENMEITLSLKNGENGQPIVLGEEELQLSYHTADHSEDYYNHDVLTHLYTRCKYEHDLKVFQLANYARLTCIYMDAVGLHGGRAAQGAPCELGSRHGKVQKEHQPQNAPHLAQAVRRIGLHEHS